jgi:hypothetical protein
MPGILVVSRDMIVPVFHARAWTVVRVVPTITEPVSTSVIPTDAPNFLWAEGY